MTCHVSAHFVTSRLKFFFKNPISSSFLPSPIRIKLRWCVLINPSLSRLKIFVPNLLLPPSSRPISTSLRPFPHHLRLRLRLRIPCAFFQDQFPQNEKEKENQVLIEEVKEEEAYGEVSRIIGRRFAQSLVFADNILVTTAVATDYLIDWKDVHTPSWVPADADVNKLVRVGGGLTPFHVAAGYG
jgi:hypothetical protein